MFRNEARTRSRRNVDNIRRYQLIYSHLQEEVPHGWRRFRRVIPSGHRLREATSVVSLHYQLQRMRYVTRRFGFSIPQVAWLFPAMFRRTISGREAIAGGDASM